LSWIEKRGKHRVSAFVKRIENANDKRKNASSDGIERKQRKMLK
jgi:hypothetical protein